MVNHSRVVYHLHLMDFLLMNLKYAVSDYAYVFFSLESWMYL